MKSIVASLFGVKYKCPKCGIEQRVNPLIASLRGVICSGCDLKTDQFHHQEEDGTETIYLAANPHVGAIVMVPLLFASAIAVANLRFGLIPIFMTIAYVLITIITHFSLKRPTLRMTGNQMIRSSTDERTFDCSPENDPHTSMVREGKGAALYVHIGDRNEPVSMGLRRDEWDRLEKVLEDCFARVKIEAPDIPAQVTEAEEELEHRHPVVFRDDAPEPKTGKLDRSGVDSFAAPCKVVVEREGMGLVVKTAIDWSASRNKNCIILAFFILALTATPMLVPFLDAGELSWHAFIVPCLFVIPVLMMFHTWIIGYCTEIRRKEITISYYFLGIPVWWRRLAVRDVRQVIPGWFNGVALETVKGTHRILHCPNRKTRNNMIVLIQRKLTDLEWEHGVSFTTARRDDGTLEIALKPASVDACIERFNTPGFVIILIAGMISLVIGGLIAFILPGDVLSAIALLACILTGLTIGKAVLSAMRRTSCVIRIRARHIHITWSRNGTTNSVREFHPGPRSPAIKIVRNQTLGENVLQISEGSKTSIVGSRLPEKDMQTLEKLIRDELSSGSPNPSSEGGRPAA